LHEFVNLPFKLQQVDPFFKGISVTGPLSIVYFNESWNVKSWRNICKSYPHLRCIFQPR